MKKILQKAFDEALDFPPLSEAVFPGDRIVVVPDAYIVEHGYLLAALVEYLLDVGCDLADVSILLTASEFEREENTGRLRSLFPESVRDEILIEGFYPGRVNACAVLSLDDEGIPLKMARTLVEADVVLPIERFYPNPPLGHYGLLSALVPRFADADIQLRFHSADSSQKREKIIETFAPLVADLANRLGILMAIEVMVSEQGEIDRSVFGRLKAIREQYAIQIPERTESVPSDEKNGKGEPT